MVPHHCHSDTGLSHSAFEEYTLWEPFTEQQEREIKLEHGSHLLPLAAPSGSSIRVEQNRSAQTVVVHENVNVKLNCLPWLERFDGGRARWLIQPLTSNQNIRGGNAKNKSYILTHTSTRLIHSPPPHLPSPLLTSTLSYLFVCVDLFKTAIHVNSLKCKLGCIFLHCSRGRNTF